jgi:hypothetical protein
MIRGGDFSMLKVWVGLEARSFLQASVDSVSKFVLTPEVRCLQLPGGAMCQVRPTFAEHMRTHHINGT